MATALIILAGTLILATSIFLLYQYLLPKPIPGIPYRSISTQRLLGDIPDLMTCVKNSQSIWPWIVQQAFELNSPIFQIWTRPFARPWVIVYDFQESQDILLRRTKEFDRSRFFGELFLTLFPDHHISKASKDPGFKHNRALVKDLMTPGFLNDVSAPSIYAAVETLIELWQRKVEIIDGRPFMAEGDIFNGALDIIFAVTFGSDPASSMLYQQVKFLEANRASLLISEDKDEPVVFGIAERPEELESILVLSDSLEGVVTSPIPLWHHWALRKLPYMKRAYATKEKMIQREIGKAVQRFESGEGFKRCAVDDVVRRETALAEKEGRPVDYYSRPIMDELFGFLIAGHDTTSTTLCWGIKYISDNPAAQTRLRSELEKAFSQAKAESRRPTTKEITSTQIAYLDAVLEEVVRLANTSNGIIRITTQDTTVLGHHIPKGTDVFLMANGPGYRSPAFEIDPASRHESARAEKGRQVGSWSGDAAAMQSFVPERWLTKDENGSEQFDATAGPHLLFGLGPRGCYGRRLAYLEMRIMIVMLVWTFKLGQCPERLSSYQLVDRLTTKPKDCYLRLEKVERS